MESAVVVVSESEVEPVVEVRRRRGGGGPEGEPAAALGLSGIGMEVLELPEEEDEEEDMEAAVPRPLRSGGGGIPPAQQQGRDTRASRAAAAAAAAAAVAGRRRKAEYPRRRRLVPEGGFRGAAAAGVEAPRNPPQREEVEVELEEEDETAAIYVEEVDCPDKDLKDDISVIQSHVAPIMPRTRPARGRRSGRTAPPPRQREAENSRSARPKTGSLHLVCKSEPDPDQEEYGATGGQHSLVGISEEEEELFISEEETPFRDDPRDETYQPRVEREAPKGRRKSQKVKEEKEKEIKVEVEVKQETELREGEEPPRKRGRRRKDDKSPRLPKRRKKPPIQYVRCEMEGCGTVLAHPRYLQHHIKYQHLLKKKYVCPHPSCGRLFRLQKQLLRHAKHHTDQRDYICEYCARAFKSSHNLAVHRMIHTGEKPLQCEICGFTCRQKASLNWHMKKHDADSFYQFSCNICGKKFEKKDSVVAHKAKSHPEVLIAEALAANAGALITNTNILATGTPESLTGAAAGNNPQGLLIAQEVLVSPGNASGSADEELVMNAQAMGMTAKSLSGERMALSPDSKLLSSGAEGLVINAEALAASTEVLIEDSDSTGP
ncbi:E3 ubiquitin-protein ligase ZFP91 isoform X1 [Latimeria chalumnae]|uniref:E3 ubiquitin-protein ligase ZFP91 isoform X1 n=1 Tax=Latimeria chalumnae TaxID=7897 RepID=UPI0006D8EAC2|nr:PREDICTED: E3 ubiquitin-protein ligase ZFP91 [Latimeria chalumnae]|eukprot:XP_014353955.1 PREDICTED: E3 ubiquitin-protein ligase ZFP91 [Latimeria chalumnae]